MTRAGRALALSLALGAGMACAADDHDAESLTSQGISGEILDTALEHCRRGERAQALAMFRAIREQLDPPPGILRVVQTLEASACPGSLVTDAKGLRIQLTTGWDSNVSQGIVARSLTISPGGIPLDIPLDDSYLPRPSAFAQAAADYSVPLPWWGLVARGSLALRHHNRASAFDLGTFGGALSREFRIGATSLRAQVEHAQVWLGGKHFQQSSTAGIQWLGAVGSNAWLAHAIATRSDYMTQPTQDARQYESGLLVERRLDPALSVYAGAALQYDQAAGQRAGGDRKGFQSRLGALWIAYGWQWRPQAVYTRWQSADPFAPGLIDYRRRNRLQQLVLQADRPLSQHMNLVLEWSARWAQDTIALYTYRSQSVTATLGYRF